MRPIKRLGRLHEQQGGIGLGVPSGKLCLWSDRVPRQGLSPCRVGHCRFRNNIVKILLGRGNAADCVGPNHPKRLCRLFL